MSNKILVVDDETEIADLIEVYKKITEKVRSGLISAIFLAIATPDS